MFMLVQNNDRYILRKKINAGMLCLLLYFMQSSSTDPDFIIRLTQRV